MKESEAVYKAYHIWKTRGADPLTLYDAFVAGVEYFKTNGGFVIPENKELVLDIRDAIAKAVDGLGYQAMAEAALSIIQPELQKRDAIIEAVKSHAIHQDCGRLCDANPDLNWLEQYRHSTEHIEWVINNALKTTTGHDNNTEKRGKR